MHKVTGWDQDCLKRLEGGSKINPSREAVLMLGLALVRGSEAVDLEDIDELLMAVGLRSATPLETHNCGLVTLLSLAAIVSHRTEIHGSFPEQWGKEE